jgi:hypothetical protein
VLQTFFQNASVVTFFAANNPDVVSRSAASNDVVELANLFALTSVFDATGNGTLITLRNTAITNAVVNSDLVIFLALPQLAQISDPGSLAVAQASVAGGNTLQSIIAVARLNGEVNRLQLQAADGSFLYPIVEAGIIAGADFPS